MAKINTTNATQAAKALDAIFRDRQKGVSWAKAMAAHQIPDPDKPGKMAKLNYSQCWLYCEGRVLPKERALNPKAEGFAAAVVKARDEAKESWGLIAVRATAGNGGTPYPESRVRKVYAEASGVAHQGQRIGHGGRWYLGERDLYSEEANLKETGTRLTLAELERLMKDATQPLARRAAALVLAERARLNERDVKELRDLATEAGVPTVTEKGKQLSKPMLVTQLARVRVAGLKADPEGAKRVKRAEKAKAEAEAPKPEPKPEPKAPEGEKEEANA